MKLVNTFLTCTGSKGMQWQGRNKHGSVIKQLTIWTDGKGKMRHTHDGAVSDAEYQQCAARFGK